MRTATGLWGVPWTAEEVAYLRENYPKVPAKDIAAALGRSYTAVHQRAKIEGFKSLHRTGINSLVPDYFRVIDTPAKAYLLGLLMADGSVSKAGQLKLELHRKDRAIVEFARDQIAPGARIGEYTCRTSPMVRFMVSSPDLTADLARHGCVNAKTLITRWPDEVPAEHEGSFVCGYFDGDGSLQPKWIYRWAVTCGCMPFLTAMQDHAEAATGVRIGGPYVDKRHEHAWSIVATGKPVRALDQWMHRDVPGLARKRLPVSGQMEMDI